jgi:hypothetical protein
MRKFIVFTLVAAPALALAQVSDSSSLGDLLLSLIQMGKAHNWVVVAGVASMIITRVLRMDWVTSKIPWFKTDLGGVVLAAVVALLSTIAPTLVAGTLAWGTIVDAFLVFSVSVASYVVPRKVTTPAPAPAA